MIVICGQHDSSEQWKGLPRMEQWIVQQIHEIRKFTTRPILVRPHPRNTIQFKESDFKNVKLRLPKRDYKTYDDTDFKVTLERTWAVVNHSSNPAMEAVIRGIPELLVIYLIFFGGSAAIMNLAKTFGYNGYIELNAFTISVIAIGIISATYSTEVLRAAYLSINQGQIEAAKSLGLTNYEVFFNIINFNL